MKIYRRIKTACCEANAYRDGKGKIKCRNCGRICEILETYSNDNEKKFAKLNLKNVF